MILLPIVKYTFIISNQNNIINLDCSSNELKQFDRLYQCHLYYNIFLTDQYKKMWECLSAKQKSYQKRLNELQLTVKL